MWGASCCETRYVATRSQVIWHGRKCVAGIHGMPSSPALHCSCTHHWFSLQMILGYNPSWQLPILTHTVMRGPMDQTDLMHVIRRNAVHRNPFLNKRMQQNGQEYTTLATPMLLPATSLLNLSLPTSQCRLPTSLVPDRHTVSTTLHSDEGSTEVEVKEGARVTDAPRFTNEQKKNVKEHLTVYIFL